jgi:hypothetical protein
VHVWPIFDCYSNMPLFVYRIQDVILETTITHEINPNNGKVALYFIQNKSQFDLIKFRKIHFIRPHMHAELKESTYINTDYFQKILHG